MSVLLTLAILALTPAAVSAGAGSGNNTSTDATSLLSHPTERSLKATFQPVWVSEVFSDFTIRDLACPGDSREARFTRECWNAAFSKFDVNGDGLISGDDVTHVKESEAKSLKNLTREDLRAGLALAAQWYPEEAMRLAIHAPTVVALVVEGVQNLDDLPPPAPSQFLIPASRPRAPTPLTLKKSAAALELALIEAHGEECVAAVVKLTVGCVGLGFGILGIQTPGGELVADLIKTKSTVVSTIMEIVKQPSLNKAQNAEASAMEVAYDVKDILMTLYQEGILTELVRGSLQDLSWWKWATTIARVGATIALWFVPGAGQAAFVLQISLSVIDAVDVWQGFQKMRSFC